MHREKEKEGGRNNGKVLEVTRGGVGIQDTSTCRKMVNLRSFGSWREREREGNGALE